MKTISRMAAFVAVLVFVVSPGWAQTSDDKAKEHDEVEDGKLQLSVYTMKGNNFSEVIVDHKTGKIAKREAITQGDDLTHAKEQSEAMAKAKRSLGAAASEAVKENKGYRVVSVFPAMKDGHPVADVTLMKGNDWKTMSEKLD